MERPRDRRDVDTGSFRHHKITPLSARPYNPLNIYEAKSAAIRCWIAVGRP